MVLLEFQLKADTNENIIGLLPDHLGTRKWGKRVRATEKPDGTAILTAVPCFLSASGDNRTSSVSGCRKQYNGHIRRTADEKQVLREERACIL